MGVFVQGLMWSAGARRLFAWGLLLIPLFLEVPALFAAAEAAAFVVDPSELGMIQWMERHLANQAVFFVIVMVAFGTLISEDLTCVTAGILVAEGAMKLPVALISCFIGILGGDLLLYLFGSKFGETVLGRYPLKYIVSPARLNAGKHWFRERGGGVVLLGRFVPGSRTPTYLAAGVLQLGFLRFASFAALATAIWVPLLTGAAAILGKPIIGFLKQFNTAVVAVLVGGIIVWVLLKTIIPQFTFKGRKLLFGKMMRIRNFEFWSPWVFYVPIALYVLTVLARRHKGLTVCTLANPGMFIGGFIGESKTETLECFKRVDEFVARSRLLPVSDSLENRKESLLQFINDAGLGYPIVLKRDRGHRGIGVRVARNEAEAFAALANQTHDFIAQEFIEGSEFGVFYYRYPNEKRGRIFSLTEKHLPTIIGNGHSTLEELVLLDKRAVCRAEVYLAANEARRYEVIPAGETVTLITVCNHCRGATFFNASDKVTSELEDAIERISRENAGFFIGRYDVRTPRVEDFLKGRNFKIIELNGVTAEATHIWHPGSRLRSAYRDIAHQWKVAYELGDINRGRLGIEPPTLREWWRIVTDYYKTH